MIKGKKTKKRIRKFKKGQVPINISKKKYLSLVNKRQNNKDSLSSKENYQLNFALKRKYCNCIEKVKYNINKKSRGTRITN